MNYSEYKLALFLSTSILGAILFLLTLVFIHPLYLWSILAIHYLMALNTIPAAMTLCFVIILKPTRKYGILIPFIHTILSVMTYICVMIWGMDMYVKGADFQRFQFAVIPSAFLSALLASIWLPKTGEQPENSANSEPQ